MEVHQFSALAHWAASQAACSAFDAKSLISISAKDRWALKQAEDLTSLPFVDDVTVKDAFAEFCVGLNFVHGNLHMTFAAVTADHSTHQSPWRDPR
jgi:hypothetical protein